MGSQEKTTLHFFSGESKIHSSYQPGPFHPLSWISLSFIAYPGVTLIFNLTVLWIFSSSTTFFPASLLPVLSWHQNPRKNPKATWVPHIQLESSWLRSVYLEITSYLCTPKLSPRVRLWFLAWEEQQQQLSVPSPPAASHRSDHFLILSSPALPFSPSRTVSARISLTLFCKKRTNVGRKKKKINSVFSKTRSSFSAQALSGEMWSTFSSMQLVPKTIGNLIQESVI